MNPVHCLRSKYKFAALPQDPEDPEGVGVYKKVVWYKDDKEYLQKPTKADELSRKASTPIWTAYSSLVESSAELD